MKKKIISVALACMATVLSSSIAEEIYRSPGDIKAAKVAFPDTVTHDTFIKQDFPKVFFSKSDIEKTRDNLSKSPELQKFLKDNIEYCRPTAELDDEALLRLVPKVGQPVVYGLGLSLDPDGVTLKWAGWQNPDHVLGKDNKVYPDEEHIDDGDGWVGPDGTRCYFLARAAGFTYLWLERQLNALTNCYAMTGEQKYAHAAAVLIDRIASSYAANDRGPLDYPIGARDTHRGGRLDRPYYQVARALMSYVWCFDTIMPSGEFGTPSALLDGKTKFDNVARNLLFNGGIYCLGFTYDASLLNNGSADYCRGCGAVGLLFGIPEMYEPLLGENYGLRAMLNVNIDRDGFYFESSHMYSIHTLNLYMVMADLFESAVRQNIPNAKSIFDDPAFFNLVFRYFDKAEVGGRQPMIGDDGPDETQNYPTNQRVQTGPKPDPWLNSQLSNAWLLWTRVKDPVHKKQCTEFLAHAYNGNPKLPNEYKILYKTNFDELDQIRNLERRDDFFNSKSVLYGGKGLAILRGGKTGDTHGLQMHLGPIHYHGQLECLSWIFMDKGMEWSYDPGYTNTHYRYGWTTVTVSHQEMTINAKDVIPSGGAEILAWQPKGTAQYAYARNPYGYIEEGAKRYERMVAQVDAPDGSLDYWLDIGIVQGGRFRDDSFHCVMGQVDTDAEFTPTGSFSMDGDRFKGQHFLPDFRLSGETDKPFGWKADGHGYGLLTYPETTSNTGNLRMRFSNAIFKTHAALKRVINVDFPGEENRICYKAYSMKTARANGVPYIIRRDTGDGVSVFAKVLHFSDEASNTSKITAVSSLAINGDQQDGIRAYRIAMNDGRQDFWFIGNGRNTCSFSNGDMSFTSNALVEVWRYDANGKLAEHHASGMEIRGKVIAIENEDGFIKLNVSWDEKLPDNIRTMVADGSEAMVSIGSGRPANWSVTDIGNNELMLSCTKTTMCRLLASPIKTEPGRYILQPDSGLFSTWDYHFAPANIEGKAILDDNGMLLGRCLGFGDRHGKSITVMTDIPQDAELPEGIYNISDIAPGDSIVLKLNQ